MPLDKTPTPLPPFEEPFFVPHALLDLPQWICWRAVWDRTKLRWDKKPICVATGDGRGFTRIEMGSSYDEAIEATSRLNLAGVGFVFHAHNKLVGIDLDRCRDPTTGEIESWAKAILSYAETYAEISPSGTGIHLFAHFNLGDLGGLFSIRNTPAKVEMYAAGRYFTITGRHIKDTPFEVNPAPQTLAALRARLEAFPLSGTTKPAPASQRPPEGSAEAFQQWSYKQSFFGRINDLALKPEGLVKWVKALFPSATLESGTGAWRVTSADLGRGLEEDISIHPDGIKDWGVHDMGDEREGKRSAIDLIIEWWEHEGGWTAEPGPVEAALWLCRTMGVEPRGLGWRSPLEDEGGGGGSSEGEPSPLSDIVDWETAKRGKVRTIQPTLFPGLDRGLLTVIGGPSGVLKSTLLMHAAVAVVCERPEVLGLGTMDYYGDVLVFANEDPDEITDKRLDAIQSRWGISGFKHKLYVLAGQIFGKTAGDKFVWKKDALVKIMRVVEQTQEAGRELALIAIDTLSSAAVGSEETNREMQEIAGLMGALIREVGSAGLFVHHLRKAGTGDKAEVEPGLDALRGGGAFGNAVRNVLFMAKPTKTDRNMAGWTEEAAELFVKLRIIKRSYGAKSQPQWFRQELVHVPVVDPRDGSQHSEGYLVLITNPIDAAAVRAKMLRDAYDKITAANVARRELVAMNKANGSARSVQTLLDLPDKETNSILDSLAELGGIVFVERRDQNRKMVRDVIATGKWEVEDEDKET